MKTLSLLITTDLCLGGMPKKEKKMASFFLGYVKKKKKTNQELCVGFAKRTENGEQNDEKYRHLVVIEHCRNFLASCYAQ